MDTRWPAVTEVALRESVRPQSYDRGEAYYERGAVRTAVRRGNRLRADVDEQHESESATVSIEFDDTGIAATECSCSSDHGGVCKHGVAVLLTYIREPEAISHRTPVSDLVADADPETLRDLVVKLVERQPSLTTTVETTLDGPQATTTSAEGDAPRVADDPAVIRRQVRQVRPTPDAEMARGVHSAPDRIADELEEILAQAWLAIEAEDGETALAVLDAIGEELAADDWIEAVPRGATAMCGFLDDFDAALAEALLTADLSESDRNAWTRQLSEWAEPLRNVTVEPPFSAATRAVTHGWHAASIQQALEGTLEAGALCEGDPPRHAPAVITARLAVLERQGRIEAYLNLAEAAGQFDAYATMLAKQGHIRDAVDYGIEHFSTPSEILTLAKTLREYDHPRAALRVGKYGLSVDGPDRAALAEWLRDCARALGERDLALKAALTAFEVSPTLAAYQAAEAIAGDDWDAIRSELLDSQRARPARTGRHSTR